MGGEPPVVAVVVRLGLLGAVEVAVEVPFPAVHRFVADGFEELGDGDLGGAEVGFISRREPAPDAISVWGAASENGGAGRGTDAAGGVGLGEADALGRELVEMGSFDARVAVAGKVSPAEVIGKEDNDVGLFGQGSLSNEQKAREMKES